MRELRVEDALLYLDQVKVEFGDRPHIYNEFLDIMKTFKTQQIDTPGVIRRVSNLFQGNKRLVLGFNTFLPEGYKIELPMDGDGPVMFTGPGQTTQILSGPGDGQRSQPSVGGQQLGGGPPNQSGLAAAARQDHTQFGQGQMRHGGPHSHQQHSPQGMTGQRGPPFGQAVGGQAQLSHGGQQHLPMHQGGRAHQNTHAQSILDMQARPRTEPLRPGQGGPGRGAGPGGLGRGRGVPGGMQSAQLGQASSRIGPGGTHPRPPAPSSGAGMAMAPSAAQHPHQMGGQAAAGPQQPQQQPQQVAQGGGQQPPLEFDHAINYVTTIKKRFSNEPETYKKFLEILHTYQKEQRGIKEVLDEVSVLFIDHPDLLREFTYFLPDAVQAQAKAQLDQAAKESEARKAAQSSKDAIMHQARTMQRPPPAPAREHAPVAPPARGPSYNAQPGIPAIPFGATQGRSEEREREIVRSAHFGNVSFAPVRPPQRDELTPQQAAAKKGRPTNIPELPRHTNTSESAFFQRAKDHLNRKELAPDKPPGSRRHTPYVEFLKCLHLFGAGIVTKDELVSLLRGLFMQGHAPKSGANAGGGVSNPSVASDAHSLLREFEDILVGRGPYADQETNFKDKSKYGSLRMRDFDFSSCEKPTPSYRTFPSDYPQSLFITNPGESEQDAIVLNNEVACVGVERSSRKHMTNSPEDYDGVRIRRNTYEEIMFRVEDERYEVDMAIERNAQAMRQIEPFAEEVSTLRENEEKDGQPIGRLQYQLKRYAMNSIPINAIGRIYGENGDEVLQHLARNPLVVLPIVYQRLRQKDAEWRKAKTELRERWNELYEANYEGSMDYLCYFYRKEIERTFTTHQLVEDCKRAKHFSKHPEKVKDHPATLPFLPSFSRKCSDGDALLFQPHISIALGKDAMPSHKDAYKLLVTKIKNNSSYTKTEREMAGRIWAEFMVPWFDYPVHWVLDEVRESFRGRLNPGVVKYASGQKVRTAFGDGTIMSYVEGNPSVGCRYKVKLPFGVASLRPSVIMHSLPQPDGGIMVRRDGAMSKDENPADAGEGIFAEKLDKKFELMFATENVYIFMRMYCLLVSLLTNTRKYLEVSPTSKDPAESYFKPMAEDQPELSHSSSLDFAGVISMLESVICRDVEYKEYEAYCRKVSKDKVYQMAVLPKLIDKCTDALLFVAKEDVLLHLYDYCLHREMDPVQLRSLCLAITPDASYRIQYDTTDPHIYFSYLPESETLLTVPKDEDTHEDHGEDEDEAMKDADDDNVGDEDAKDEGDALDDDGEDDDDGENGSGPPSKRTKLK